MRNHVERKKEELSFTLLEVIVAVGLLTSVVLNVVSGQGSLFEVTDYSQKATEATWLAKRLMSQV
jgi:Tfp pilus assembly protein PilV